MKVWLTEFSCGDGRDNKPMEKHLAYMSDVFPQLDAADHVFRYVRFCVFSQRQRARLEPCPYRPRPRNRRG